MTRKKMTGKNILPVVTTKFYTIIPSCIECGKPLHITNGMYPTIEQDN